MRYWYIKEHYSSSSGHSDFSGYREKIFRGEESPEEIICKYVELKCINGELLKEYLNRHEKLKEEKNFDPDFYYDKEWKINWRELRKYDVPYEENPTKGMIEITEEEMKEILK